jgi:hypothetical protein
MSRDNAVRMKLVELAEKMGEQDPRAARVLRELACVMQGSCTGELARIAERLLRRVVTAPPASAG